MVQVARLVVVMRLPSGRLIGSLPLRAICRRLAILEAHMAGVGLLLSGYSLGDYEPDFDGAPWLTKPAHIHTLEAILGRLLSRS